MSRSKEKEHNRGQKDFSETKDNLLGPSRRTPWSGPFESQEDYEERLDAYNKGFDNAAKNEDDKSSCYLSTAAVQARRKSIDCEELKLLRKFRDEFVRGRDGGEEAIAKYYRVSPILIEAINDRQDSIKIWKHVYETIVEQSLALIQTGLHEEAFDNYMSKTLDLVKKYLR
jgi:hypothetical protein